MKKLFTLVAFLAIVMGAKAEWVEDYKIDYSQYSGFPFYVMGYVPEWYDGVMTDLGANYAYTAVADATEDGEHVFTNDGAEYVRTTLSEPAWHQYFVANGITTELDGNYTVKVMVRASEACSVTMNFQWSWSESALSQTMNVGTDWEEIELSYTGIGGTSSWIVAQPGTATAKIEWKYLTVSHNQKEARPVTWLEQLENGDAETPWGDLAEVAFDDTENNYKVCAWSKVNQGNPTPAPIEADPKDASNHVFVVHATDCVDASADASAWDNQFWIESPKSWKSGQQIKIHFRYMASQNAKTNTQIHKQNPSDYLHWQAVGDVAFTTEWQEFDKTFTFSDAMTGGWSIAFNLNPDVKTATDFYFDDLSWQIMKLDEGYFVAGCNPDTGLEYDFDNAVQFEYDDDEGCYVATIGEKDAYVSQVMVSTVRGEDQSFKGATLKPSGTITNDAENWLDYTSVALAKLNLPGAGVWKIRLDDVYSAMSFEMLEGDIVEPIEINPNPTVTTVNGVERDYTSSEQEGGTGNPWDNQFIIMANRPLEAGESVVIEFDYVSSIDATVGTQNGGGEYAGQYVYWEGIGNVDFTTEVQHFSKTFTVPAAADGMQAINFNMAVIKEACDYTVKNVVWKLEDNTESLINQEGGENFYIKTGAGTQPYCPAGINEVVADKASKISYNVAGQRVSNNYKGIVINNGKKYLNK